MNTFITKKRLIWAGSVLALALVLWVGYYVYSILSFGNNIQADREDSPFKQFHEEQDASDENQPPKWSGTERVNVLLLGGDDRGLAEGETPRSDTLMIASLDPVTKKAHLFSILRDSYVSIPDRGMDRINAALAYGGPELAMRTVSEWLDIPVQYYIYVDFQGFVKLIDAIGGIDFYVEKDMYYSSRADGPEYDINLKKGQQHMDGHTALQYVRFRYDALSDYARTERQRKFMTAVAKKMQSFSSILKLPNTLKAIEPYIETNLSLRDMWSLGDLGKSTNTSEIITAQLPPLELLREEKIGGADVVTSNPSAVKQYVQEKFAEANKVQEPEAADTDLSETAEPRTGQAAGTNE
ncbi:LytR family transcriptional regulator [Xylanibacillus composti]|uniref:Cell envelope-related transcriptional attenuator domain-containing protein n=1 Tax=Xylanibacillus composti TaxID=1572762 RepID=A0A8J4H437_9BACL|nr:LCP family protein [Xylanibacillus composti]MDT9725877.1 LytR family transcriptional regulator [Xylanibacillus composti]GIQ69166.1 hypothetical protein XYCOK13_19900 [Xylanibacillus composti]